MRAFIAGLPKAELHMHLEGSIEPDLMFELAGRNGVELPWPSPRDLQAAYDFRNLQSFLDLYYQGCRVLVGEPDFYDMTMAYLRRAHADNVVHAEVFLGPQTFLDHGVEIATIMNPVLAALEDGHHQWGMTAGLVVSAQRHRSEADAFALLKAVSPWTDRILGFGIGGAEVGNPPGKFARFFAECGRLGLHRTAHAGEEGPASYVRDAVELLEVDRIDHGVACLEDPQLVADLVARQVPLTVCPLSNLKLAVVPSLVEHPLPDMLAAGLQVSVNSDDPSYFGGYINENLWRCHTDMGLSKNDLVVLARNSFRSSFLPPDRTRHWIDAVDAYATAHPAPSLRTFQTPP
ncbi:adenosine deaminase [Nocardia sp. NPDC020380]|uniref:adenosine deaminase n=1 Tax=Nocardia sp. NPDC020380 TaxID=3364309 RepID=UPI00378D6B4B